MRGRAGTLIIVLLWLGTWGLLYIHGLFFFVAFFAGAFLALVAYATREKVSLYSIKHSDTYIFMPTRRRHVQHNQRARLQRRRKGAQALVKDCERLMEEFTDDRMRFEVLKAERDTALRVCNRIKDDLNRLELFQRLEEKERKFKQLTGGRS